VWCALALFAAWWKSPTVDETVHLPAGLSYWEHRDFRLNPEHPLLFKWLAAAPVWWLDHPPLFMSSKQNPRSSEGTPWHYGNQGQYGNLTTFYAEPAASRRRMVLGRLVPILFGLGGIALAWWWGREAGRSRGAGAAAALLLALYPEYFGHAIYVAFDVPQLVSGAAIAALAWSWWKNPTLARGIALAVAGGLLAQIKLPVSAMLFLTAGLMVAMSAASPRHRKGAAALLLACIASWWFWCWATALFRFSYFHAAEPLASSNEYIPPVLADALNLRQRAVNWLWEYRLLPETTLATILCLDAFSARTYFFWGESAARGSLLYFPATVLLKTPLALLAAMAAGVAWLLRGVARASASRRHRLAMWAILAGPTLVLAAALVSARVTIGHRHILGIYFPLCVAAGAVLARGWHRGGAARSAAAALIALEAAAFAWTYPHGATYFNLLAGGSPAGGARFVRDSNTDWGQDAATAAALLKRHGHTRANVALVGFIAPENWGIAKPRWINADDPPWMQPDSVKGPDPNLPTLVGVNALDAVRRQYPGLYDGPPDDEANSVLYYAPVAK
jgi:hypothetical protein